MTSTSKLSGWRDMEPAIPAAELRARYADVRKRLWSPARVGSDGVEIAPAAARCLQDPAFRSEVASVADALGYDSSILSDPETLRYVIGNPDSNRLPIALRGAE